LPGEPPFLYTELMSSLEQDGGGGTQETVAEAAEVVVNFDEPPLAQVELDGVEYRVDAGRAGTALCVSSRASGSWDWQFCAEARWQTNGLRCKPLSRSVLSELSKALAEVASAGD